VDPFTGTPYRLIGLLGQGGMGEVYEVEHEGVGTRLVAKVLLHEFADDAVVVDRMRVEAQALAKLSHPNIINVIDFRRSADGRPFYVMDLLNGRTLGEELRARGPFPATEAVGIVRQVLSALDAAHALGLVHRDIKLDNVFLHRTARGEMVVKVLDFGVAKVLAGRSDQSPAPPMLPTAEGAVVGTPRYLSPEQVRGRDVDHRADIYAAGLVLYTLLCGRGPFSDVKQPGDLYTAHLTRVPEPPSTRAPNPIPAGLDRAILRALEKEPAARFQTAADFDRALAAVARGQSAAIGFLPTEPSPAPAGFARDQTDPAPPPEGARDATGPSPTEVLGPKSKPEPTPLSTRTAKVKPEPSDAPARLAPARPVPDKELTVTYVASSVTAVVASLVGFWLIGAHTPFGVAGTLVVSIVLAGACALVIGRG
jgi:serine/threonine-protein kinase